MGTRGTLFHTGPSFFLQPQESDDPQYNNEQASPETKTVLCIALSEVVKLIW